MIRIVVVSWWFCPFSSSSLEVLVLGILDEFSSGSSLNSIVASLSPVVVLGDSKSKLDNLDNV